MKNNVPNHVAIIMDGNGRWAKKRFLPRNYGHAEGAKALEAICENCDKLGIKYLTVYAFSTENWKRSTEEIGGIMKLLDKYLHEAIRDMRKKNIRMKVFGDVSRLSPQLRELIAETDEISQTIEGFQANICINYGGRAEIVRAAQAAGPTAHDGHLLASDGIVKLSFCHLILRSLLSP